MCDSVNHSRFPKEDHLPNWERRDNKVTKGDRAERVQQKWAGIVCAECVRMDVSRSQFRRFRIPWCSVRPSLLRGVTRRGLVVVTGLTFREACLSRLQASGSQRIILGPMQNMPEERRLQIPVVANGWTDRQTDMIANLTELCFVRMSSKYFKEVSSDVLARIAQVRQLRN